MEEWSYDLWGCYSNVRNSIVNQQGISLDLRPLPLIVSFKLNFEKVNYQTNKHKYWWINKQIEHIKLYMFHSASVFFDHQRMNISLNLKLLTNYESVWRCE